MRNGVDVAKSLMVRERKLLKLRTERFDERMKKYSFRSYLERAGYKGSPRCLGMNGGFQLWAEYVEQADRVLAGLSNPILRLRYEDILADPKVHLPALSQFCQLEAGPDLIAKAAKQIDTSRALAYATDSASAAFYETVKENSWMTKFGY